MNVPCQQCLDTTVERLYREVRDLALGGLDAVTGEAVSFVTDQEAEGEDSPHPGEVLDRWTTDVIRVGRLLGKIRRTDWNDAWVVSAQWLGGEHAITRQLGRIWRQEDPEDFEGEEGASESR